MQKTHPRLIVRLLLALIVAWRASPAAAADVPSGEKIYASKCAYCHGKDGHGKDGRGTKRSKQALAGDRSLAQLADLIGKTMPEDDPGSLSPGDLKAVAAYTHQRFYRQPADAKDPSARIELARLTVNQHRQAVADLVAGFRWRPNLGTQHGLKGEYFKTRHFRNEDRALERVDPEVNFDFGTNGPADKMEPNEFSARWTGVVIPTETGVYEFVVRTEHAARLWVNETDWRRPLVDGWVKSGADVDHAASVYLVAGRAYPLKLEYTKAKQGVDDSAKNKGKPVPAVKSSVSLRWKRPTGAPEPVPARCLVPVWAPDNYVVSSPFPPDDRSYGWERGTTVSKAWDQATTDAAIDAADYIAPRLNEFAGTNDKDKDREKKVREFGRKFTERAFRRPLTDADVKSYVDKQFAAAADLEGGARRVVIRALKSPRFLYREVGGEPDDFDVAARLSFGLWDSIPDQELWNAAALKQLRTREQVARQAYRMLADPRARAKLRSFLLTWLKADTAQDLTKDAKLFPGFDAAVISDLRTSLELFLDDVIASDGADYRQLLLSDTTFLNGRLSKFYGGSLPADAPWTKVKLEPDRRSGVLSHPYLMTSFAHSNESSPILRGVFLARGVLGLALRPPPEAVAPLAADLHPSLTTRERVTLQTKPAGCMTCHGIINQLGFTLETFDAVGKFRTQDHKKPVDPTGTYRTRDGKTVTFRGVRDLAAFLSTSEEAQAAFAEQMFHHLVQQAVQAYGPGELAGLRAAFAAKQFNIRALAVEVLATSALKPRDRGPALTKTDTPAGPPGLNR